MHQKVVLLTASLIISISHWSFLQRSICIPKLKGNINPVSAKPMSWKFDSPLLSSPLFSSPSHRAVPTGAEAAGGDTTPDRYLRPPELHQRWRGPGGPEGACAVRLRGCWGQWADLQNWRTYPGFGWQVSVCRLLQTWISSFISSKHKCWCYHQSVIISVFQSSDIITEFIIS